jgi:hypothetical protein
VRESNIGKPDVLYPRVEGNFGFLSAPNFC